MIPPIDQRTVASSLVRSPARFAVVTCTALALGGCNYDNVGGNECNQPAGVVTRIDITAPPSIRLGHEGKVRATAYNGADFIQCPPPTTWSSSNENIATVEPARYDATVMALAAGTVWIRARIHFKTDSVRVTVLP